jgi:hypothetical protein
VHTGIKHEEMSGYEKHQERVTREMSAYEKHQERVTREKYRYKLQRTPNNKYPTH